MTQARRKSVSNEFEPNLFLSLSLRVILAVLVVLISTLLVKLFKSEDEKVKNISIPKYWAVCVNKWNPTGSLRSMNRVFSNLGYESVNASKGDSWDFLWSIEYPFRRSHIHNKTKLYEPLFTMDFKFLPHQRVNHIPGAYSFTNKLSLGTKTKSKYLLPTFEFPDHIEDFQEYMKNNPEAVFIEKNYGNRGVILKKVEKFNFEASEKIYQKFIDKPFLIDGHAFDFGVYVLITSVNPLRIYRYAGENFIRFCFEEYHPFDANNTDKYVVSGTHLGAHEMSSFEGLYEDYGFSFKLIFEKIIRERGFDVDAFWTKIDDAIKEIILKNEKFVVEEILQDSLPSHNFFELVRADFIFDENLTPFIIEINMSPNLTPAEEIFEEHSLIYEQLIYNTLQIVSAGSYYDMIARVSDDTIISNYKNIAVNIDQCSENNCSSNCNNPQCETCLPCVNHFMTFHFHEAYRENMKRGNFKRIFPSLEDFNDGKIDEKLTANNQIMLKWFKAQCENDVSWC